MTIIADPYQLRTNVRWANLINDLTDRLGRDDAVSPQKDLGSDEQFAQLLFGHIVPLSDLLSVHAARDQA